MTRLSTLLGAAALGLFAASLAQADTVTLTDIAGRQVQVEVGARGHDAAPPRRGGRSTGDDRLSFGSAAPGGRLSFRSAHLEPQPHLPPPQAQAKSPPVVR